MWRAVAQLLACVAVLVSGIARAALLPVSSNFLHMQCDGHRRVYAPLITNQLSPYRAGEGLSVDEILQLEGAADPRALIVNGVAMTNNTPAINMASYWIPLLKKLTSKVILPDLILATDIWDQPEDDTVRQGGPWFGYCNIMFQTTNLMLPAGAGVTSHLRCGKNCEAFTNLDKRESKAIFLGSSTGWWVGRRRAAVLAGILHNDTVYSGYTQMIDLPPDGLPAKDEALAQTKPKMELADQIKKYKYIINADGHCAALRMRQLLASDSAILWVETNQIEWFYPLLQPFVHYIPVRYLDYETDDPLHDVITKIEWAERHPRKVQDIVRNANKFATSHLSDHAITCYSVQLLDEYARLFHDPHKLQAVAQNGDFSMKHAGV
ncbi:TPA: hypothetical protein ACH3X1_009293 [Trebouxia sp. C0004]